MTNKGSKRFGRQACDACGRDFEVANSDWDCPHCGFDNRVGKERAQHAARIGGQRSAEVARQIKSKSAGGEDTGEVGN